MGVFTAIYCQLSVLRQSAGCHFLVIQEKSRFIKSVIQSNETKFRVQNTIENMIMAHVLGTVNPEIFPSISFSRIALKDILTTEKFCD